MALTSDSLADIPIAFASPSIGCKAEHTLPKRIDAIAAAGFKAIELAFYDIVSFASVWQKHEVGNSDYGDLCSAAKVIKSMCDAKGLQIFMLQPFANFEGWPEGSSERREAFERARGWIQVMEACGTDMLQVGSSDSPAEKIGTDRNRFVADLSELADMLAEHGFKLAYENWCWSTHAPDWQDVWDIVRRIDKPNVGLCLDTFQTGGGEWGDPTTRSGMLEVPGKSQEQVEKDFQQSLSKLSETIPKEKIYLLQISDAYRMQKPLDPSSDRPRNRWSGDYRPLPFDGGYLPVTEISKAILRTGFRGWFSYEVFDSGPDGKGKDYELDDFANASIQSHQKLMEACREG